MALPLVDAARHNDVKPELGRELMIVTHDDDDDDACMYVGQKFSRTQDLKRHDSQMPDCGTVKRRRTVAERAKLPFKCETCGERFSRQQDIARHKCSSSSRTTSSARSQTK